MMFMLLGSVSMVMAQTRKKAKTGTHSIEKKPPQKENKDRSVKLDSTQTLLNSGSHQAFSNAAVTTDLPIADPTIRALNARANGIPVNIGRSGIVGVPKGTYGYSNGHIFFRTTSATSLGTTTGSGTVGTGTSIGSIGTAAPVIGVNGKSPYAGTNMWGTDIMRIRLDSSQHK